MLQIFFNISIVPSLYFLYHPYYFLSKDLPSIIAVIQPFKENSRLKPMKNKTKQINELIMHIFILAKTKGENGIISVWLPELQN